jgi:hypothetical protein
VTDGTSAFLTTADGVATMVRHHRPQHPAGGRRDRRRQQRSNEVTHLISAPPRRPRRRVLPVRQRRRPHRARGDPAALPRRRPARPAPEETFQTGAASIGSERIDLAWYGSTTADNIYIHLPDRDTLMLVDIVNAGWAPSTCPASPRHPRASRRRPTPAYPWKHFIRDHGRRHRGVIVHQQYMADAAASVRRAIGTVDPTLAFQVRREQWRPKGISTPS